MGAVAELVVADARSGPADVVRVGAQHIDALTEFIRTVWDPAATTAAVRRSRAIAAERNPVDPGEERPTYLFLLGGRAVGHVTTLPARMWTGGVERRMYWIKGLEVLPAYRNGPVGSLLLKHAVRDIGAALSICVNPPAVRLLCAVGLHEFGIVPNYLLPVNPGRILDRVDVGATGLSGLPRVVTGALHAAQRSGLIALIGRGAGGMFSALTAVTGNVPRTLRIDASAALDAGECDALWERVRGDIRAGLVRDGAYLYERYVVSGRQRYHFVTVRERGTLAGLAVVRQPRVDGDARLRGLRVATLSDLVYAPGRDDVVRAALAGAAMAASALDADALLCTASHARLRRSLFRRGFVPIPGNVRFLARAAAGAPAPPWPMDLRAWWITRGDSDADEVF